MENKVTLIGKKRESEDKSDNSNEEKEEKEEKEENEEKEGKEGKEEKETKNEEKKEKKSKKSRKREKREKKEKNKEKNEKKNENAWQNLKIQEKELKNEKFEYYYKNQLAQFFPTQEKFEELLSKLREKLPTVFRISKAHHFHEGYKKLLLNNTYIKSLLGEQSDIIKIELKNLTSFKEWLNLVYNININRMELKKNDLLKNFHKFIQFGVDGGVISRQEAVSMIPPMLMQTSPTDKIFDMCAAPGSKTAQFLETVYENYDFLDKKQYLKDTGFVLANDNNHQRAYMMVHQLKRLNTAGMVVICHDAQLFPTIYQSDSYKDKLFFDKILADVPCSSDAVMRKLPLKWKKWSTKEGFSLHKLQIQILKRGINLLKEGGVISYSTCSLNPIENEAVVSEIMRTYSKNGELEILDVKYAFKNTDIVPHPGLNDWKVMIEDKNDKNKLNIIKDINDPLYLENKSLILPSCFPQNDIKNFGLEKCNRFFPNDSDTSGFFITLIKKVKSFKTEDVDKNKIVKPNIPEPKRKNDEEKSSVLFVKDKFPEKINWIKNYYGIEDEFPINQLLTFSNICKKINFASKGVTDLLELDKDKKLIIENAGVKLFKANKQKNENLTDFCLYRICQDGMMYVLPFMHKRIYFVEEKFFAELLSKKEIKHDDIYDNDLKIKLKEDKPGSIVLVNVKCKPTENELKWGNEKEKEVYNNYLRNNFIDAICCHNAVSRITTMINKEHQHIFELKYKIENILDNKK